MTLGYEKLDVYRLSIDTDFDSDPDFDVRYSPLSEKEPKMHTKKLTRRDFIRKGSAAGAALSIPSIVPASALGRDGRTAASERLVMGGIGLGGRGSSDLKWLLGEEEVQFVAVCDVRRNRREAAKKAVDDKYGNKDCRPYRDMRNLYKFETEIDAMLIATGDRWHGPAAIMAMKAGMDLYCEKPGTMTVTEGRALVKTAERYGRVFQTGAQRLCEPKFAVPTDMALKGALGEIKTVRAHLWPKVQDVTKNDWLPAEPEPPREELDWDLWLGPSPWRPYNPGYLGGCGAWGIYWDLAAGVAGWGSHTIIQCQKAVGIEDSSPVEYVYPGNNSGDGLVARFANGVELVMQFEGGWRGTCGVRFEGTEGWASVADGYSKPDFSSPALLKEYQRRLQEYLDVEQHPENHMRDFLNCVRSRQTTMANPEFTHRSMTTNHAMNICLHLKRDLKWDPVKEKFVDDPEANRFLSRAMRAPWVI